MFGHADTLAHADLRAAEGVTLVDAAEAAAADEALQVQAAQLGAPLRKGVLQAVQAGIASRQVPAPAAAVARQ